MLKQTTINIFAAAMLAVSATGCSDKWDEHYDPSTGDAAQETIYELLKADTDHQKFCKMVELAGYADLLNTTQTFTIWVPSDDALSDVDINDLEEVKRVVANHIARFNVSSSTSPAEGVRMYNGKLLYFESNTFGGVALGKADIRVKNGVMHMLNGMIPYTFNIREYIDTHSETSLLSDFLKRYDEMKFDEAASAPIDVDENGATIYDSVTVSYNRLLEHVKYGLGNILAEDSLFTMLVPDNQAWTKAYERISPLFNVYDKDQAKADSINDVQTSQAIIQDLIFRSRITDASQAGQMRTTSGNLITDMPSYFSGSNKIAASNGVIYLSPSIDYPENETFNAPIEVEAEEATGRLRGPNTAVYSRTVDADNPLAKDISGGNYIEVTPTSGSAQPAVTFDIPNTLSTSYDIYARFVPACIDDATVTNDSTRVRFVLTYLKPDGNSGSVAFAEKSFVTSPTEVTTIKVAEDFTFPVSNYYDRLWLMDENNDESAMTVTTKLYISTNVTAAEFNNGLFTRRFRLDCIYLVPSQK